MKKTISSLYLLFIAVPFFAQVIYVNVNVTGGTGDGSSWENAMPGLAPAISQAGYGDTIWVAEGQYLPTPGTNRNFSFVVKDGVRMFGGFKGGEADLSERDWETNETLLSGDIGVPGDSTDNCYSVVFCAFADSTTLIDGFVIEGGNADNPNGSSTSSGKNGGGLYLTGASSAEDTRLRVENCTFRNNSALNAGGGMYARMTNNGGATPIIKNCTFSGNTADNGGGLYKDGVSDIHGFTIENCLFTDNFAHVFGGGVSIKNSVGEKDNLILNCRFEHNTSVLGGGGFYQDVLSPSVLTKIINSQFGNNRGTGGSEGGAIYSSGFFETKSIEVSFSYFNNNSSGSSGGAISAVYDGIEINNSYFFGNEAFGSAVIEIDDSYFVMNNSGVVNSHSSSNSSGRIIHISGSPSDIYLTNCSFNNNIPGNSNPLIAYASINEAIFNNLIFQNSKGADSEYFSAFSISPITISNSFIDAPDCSSLANPDADITCGPGMLYGLDPMFMDTAAGDFRLHPCSPARNAGDNAAALAAGLATDIAGLDRIQEGTVDMGAHETPPFSVSLDTIVDVDCAGENTGSFTVGVYSGCGPFALSFNGIASPADTSATITLGQLYAIPYEVIVSDITGRTDTLNFEIASPGAVTADIDHTEVDCSLSLPASASATASGGTGPISFLWDNGDDGASTENLGTGQHYLTLTDSLNCSVTDSFWVGFTGALPLGSEIENIACFGGANGTAELLPGGLSPHFFQWDDGAVDSLLEDLGPGQYSATVTDALGCRDSVQFEITQPDSLVLLISGTDTLCFGAMDGELAAIPSGGTPGFIFDWDGEGMDSLLTGLSPDGYSLTVTDANGCTATASATIAGADGITVQATVTHATGASVSDGSIELTATEGGQPPFTYLWGNGGTGTGIGGLPTGDYSLTITDSDSCQQVFGFFVDVETAAFESFSDGLETQVAPNPVPVSSDFFLFSETQDAQLVSLRLSGIDGKVLWSRKVEIPSGETNHLLKAPRVAGMYFLVIENEKGERKTLELIVY